MSCPIPYGRGFSVQNRVLRLLTLACFFHFSGLNNGFTTFIVSSGRIQRIDFAPVLAQKVVAALHPLHWKKIFLDPVRFHLFPTSANVIERASQRAIQYTILESLHLQSWISDFCRDGLAAVPVKPLKAPTARRSGLKQRVPDALNPFSAAGEASNLSAPAETPFLARGGEGVFTENSNGYLQGDRRDFMEGGQTPGRGSRPSGQIREGDGSGKRRPSAGDMEGRQETRQAGTRKFTIRIAVRPEERG